MDNNNKERTTEIGYDIEFCEKIYACNIVVRMYPELDNSRVKDMFTEYQKQNFFLDKHVARFTNNCWVIVWYPIANMTNPKNYDKWGDEIVN